MICAPVVDLAAGAASKRWWRHGDSLARFLRDHIVAAALRLRPGSVLDASTMWAPDKSLTEAGLGFDSLERLDIATTISAALRMDATGLDDYLLVRPRFGDWCDIVAQSLDRYSESLVFRTSGSTGGSKSYEHQLATLLQEVEGIVRLLGSSPLRVLAAVPSHHIYGFLLTILLPLYRDGTQVLDVRDKPGSLSAMARAGDLVAAHPAYWSMTLKSDRRWPSGVLGVTSTAPCSDEVASGLVQAGLTRLLQIHGATETGGIGWRDDPADAYTLMEHWKIASKDGLHRLGVADAAAVQVPDDMIWLGSRSYRIAGRRDGAVQVGGINVFPSQVKACLLQHSSVADAAVRLMTPGEGERLKAFIVPKDPAQPEDALRDALTRHVQSALTPPERPRSFRFGPLLPRSDMGKETDWAAG